VHKNCDSFCDDVWGKVHGVVKTMLSRGKIHGLMVKLPQSRHILTVGLTAVLKQVPALWNNV
jgi:hypothetical protein